MYKNLIYMVGILKYTIEIQGTHDEGKILKTGGCFSIICMQQGIPTCDEQDFNHSQCVEMLCNRFLLAGCFGP